jgi:Glycosyl transferases group 1
MAITSPDWQCYARRSPSDARVLLFSMRNLTRHVSRCGGYEFEDVIFDCDDVDMLAPVGYRPRGRNPITRRIGAMLLQRGRPFEREIRVAKEYELFFAFCMNPHDLRCLNHIKGLHDRCRRSVCVIGEIWPSRMAEYSGALKALRNFDQIFSTLYSSVDLIAESTGRPCHFLALGTDALRFCPFPDNPARSIDVYNMGRRAEDEHRALLACAERGKMFYVYDTVADFDVRNTREHRVLLANLVKRSRYFITRPAKFKSLAETNGIQEMGARLFEGAAGGAVMMGNPPRCTAYNICFDWPDAVIPTGSDDKQILASIAELDAQPQRLLQIRQNNIIHSLRRHDWAYRWRQTLDCVGLPATTRLVEREKCLNQVAEAVECIGRTVSAVGR